ncbi:putative DNA damage-binding protein 1 [Paratrimastix pyriformis]|uniref:DNA damage-binding protein 1 n=1 Tax=Paratrimastix pyriformis TaxID=342808 RepID=A0ABQ8UL21_9EUKA|nr:putative DNA damage-binding protein 1 [Paratrimastix pyriformis]
MQNYVVTAHKPTAVTASLLGNFTGPNDQNLILAKCTHIEIFMVSQQGIQPFLDIPINGKIAVMQFFRPQGENQDLLFFTTEKYKFTLLEFHRPTCQLRTRACGDIHDRIGRPTEMGQLGSIDPQHRMICLHLYDGLLKIIPVHGSRLSEAFNVRLEELRVVDMCFLDGCPAPTLAILYEDAKECRHIKSYVIDAEEKELTQAQLVGTKIEKGSSLLVPLPAPYGPTIISYYPPQGAQTKSIAIRGSSFKAWGRVDPLRYLVGDIWGNLSLLQLQLASDAPAAVATAGPAPNAGRGIESLTIAFLGKTSIPSTLTYIDKGVAYVGSAMGDAQVVRLSNNPEQAPLLGTLTRPTAPSPTRPPRAAGSNVTVLESFTNLAPILDLALVDLDRQGQNQIITCSGGFKDGSLRIIRTGIGINEEASIEASGIKGMWALRAHEGDTYDKYLVQSFIEETRVMGIEGEEFGEVELPGLDSAVPTLNCANVQFDQYVQVTQRAVRLIAAGTLQLAREWLPPQGLRISTAAVTPSQIVVATSGGHLVSIAVALGELREDGHMSMGAEVACLDLGVCAAPAGGPSVPVTASSGAEPMALEGAASRAQPPAGPARFLATGMWDGTVRLLAMPALNEVARRVLGAEVIPRSLLLQRMEGIEYLLCGLGDGHLATFLFDPEHAALTDPKRLLLATHPVTLRRFASNGASHVFAASDRPTVISSTNRKLFYSNVNVKEVNQMCPFHASPFPDSLVLATEQRLIFGTVDAIQKLHIRTIPLGAMPRRLAHVPEGRALGVLLHRVQPDPTGQGEEEQDSLVCIDDETFETTHLITFAEAEMGTALCTARLGGPPAGTAAAGPATAAAAAAAAGGPASSLGAPAAGGQRYLVAGTGFCLPTEQESSKGRILVFRCEGHRLELVAEKEVRGAVYALAELEGKLLATVNNKVVVYDLTAAAPGQLELTQLCAHTGHIMALYAQTRGNFILVGDLIRSMALLQFNNSTGTLTDLAHDYNAHWMTGVAFVADDLFLGAENASNLFTCKRNADAPNEEERSRLEVVGEFHLGSFVNRFREGSIAKLGAPEATSTLVYGAVDGSLGLVAQLPPDVFAFAEKVQHEMTKKAKGVGGLSHEHWRAFANERRTAPARAFVDGDIVEAFYELPPDRMEEVARALQTSTEEILKRIDDLTRLH